MRTGEKVVDFARPLDLPLGCDPTLGTHKAYGLGHLVRDAEAQRMVEAAARRLARELGVAVSLAARVT